MNLIKLAKDQDSKKDGSQAMYLDEEGWFTVQGMLVDADTLGNVENFVDGEAGRPEPPDPDHDAWCAQIAVNVGAGKSVQRVHVVREPPSDYLRYELTWGYAPNVRAGEDVRIIPVRPTQQWPPGVPQDDFWLFDDTELYRMHYSPNGIWLGVERVTEREAVNAAHVGRDAALRLGTPWAVYLSDHPDLVRHLDLARAS